MRPIYRGNTYDVGGGQSSMGALLNNSKITSVYVRTMLRILCSQVLGVAHAHNKTLTNTYQICWNDNSLSYTMAYR